MGLNYLLKIRKNFDMSLYSNLIYFYTRKILPGFKVSKDDLVVDIGSGDKPFWRADVFVDDLSLNNVQRASETETIHNLGTFVNSNVSKLPFRDNSFDFSFCSHLLEHVEDPEAAIREITRISKSGYLEIPNGIIETIQPFVSHLWFIFKDRDKLIFVRKSNKMHKVFLQNGKGFLDAINKENNPFIRIYWVKTIKVEVIDELKNFKKYNVPKDFKTSKKSKNYYLLFVKILRAIFYKKKEISRDIYN